jgi:hypothetical protein
MVCQDELRALAAGMPAAPARVATLDIGCQHDGFDVPAGALVEAREAGCRATLRLTGVSAQAETIELLDGLAARLEQDGATLAPQGLALPGTVARPHEIAIGALGVCRSVPSVYVLLPQSALDAIQRGRTLPLAGLAETDARRWWGGLLALAASAASVSLVPEAPGPGVSLLAPGQRWVGPSPGSGELIPAAPRRLRLDVDFPALVEASGDHPLRLGRLAERIVTLADAALGQLPGCGGPRRLALELRGIARAVIANGRDPRSFAALAWVKSRVGAFREGARAASVRLARTMGGGVQPFAMPGVLEVADTGAFDRALLTHGARHSHLVCISPWSLAPPEHGRDCLGLMPALAAADSVAWRRPDGECAPALYSEALRFAWAVALRS